LTKGLNILLVLVLLSMLLLSAKATYTVQNLNTTLTLNKNTSGAVTETFKVSINNASVSQYSTNRLALNLTLSDWQQLIGPMLVQHIINSNESLYNFKFFPGPVVTVGGQNTAYIIMTYTVNNVTTVNETAPRQFLYQFNPKVLNFEHAVSGEVLTGNTTFTIVVPSGAVIKSAYPVPDQPPYAFTQNYDNITSVSWLYGEPLSKFSFTFLITQSLQEEVGKFFESAYNFFGIFTYIIIAAAILLFMVYTYYRASR
jgi:hypothetical protein